MSIHKITPFLSDIKDFFKNSQGWRMRFNSNSVKNSPDYVK